MRHARRVRLTAAEARRIAFAAQGFDRGRPAGGVDGRHFARMLGKLGLLQLDYVNVLVPAHYLVAWSRLGAYDRARLHAHLYDSGRYTEQWAHEASVVPVESWPLFEYRRRAWPSEPRGPLAGIPDARRYLDDVLEQVRLQGALTADMLPPVPGPRRKPGDWHRSMPRRALEHHFGRGALAVRSRKPNFQRVYDLPERLIPEEHLAVRMAAGEARCRLLRRAADALGVATLQDLADYYRISPREAGPLLERLVAAGELRPVAVEGWRQSAYLSPAARLPRQVEGACLLSPFDPLVWFRPRAERLFGFRYRIEIYVPAHQRRWGYYVLPFRLGDRLVGRVDLKADRDARRLLLLGSWLEAGSDAGHVAARLASELAGLADWLGLADIVVRRHNGFSRQLATQVRKQR